MRVRLALVDIDAGPAIICKMVTHTGISSWTTAAIKRSFILILTRSNALRDLRARVKSRTCLEILRERVIVGIRVGATSIWTDAFRLARVCRFAVVQILARCDDFSDAHAEDSAPVCWRTRHIHPNPAAVVIRQIECISDRKFNESSRSSSGTRRIPEICKSVLRCPGLSGFNCPGG